MKANCAFAFIAFAANSFGQMEWESKVIDAAFGSGERQVTIEFKGRNTSDQSLRILRVYLSCGCSSSIKKEMTILPGAEFTLPVTVNTSGISQRTTDVAVKFKDVLALDHLVIDLKKR